MAAFAGPDLDQGYQLATTLRLLSILFPLGILIWVLATPGFSSVAKVLFARCQNQDVISGSSVNTQKINQAIELRIGFIFLTFSIIALGVYLRTVPLMSTGLVTLFTDPINSAMAREESLKLVTSSLPRYSLVWHIIVLAPILVGLAVQAKFPLFSWRNILRIAFVALLIASAMLTGARAPAGHLFGVIGLVILLRMGLRRGVWALVPSLVFIMLIASILTVMREGNIAGIDAAVVYELISDSMFKRIFEVAYKTGVWTNHLAQDLGNFGIGSIRPLAVLFNEPYIPVANLSGLTYAQNPLATISATTSFLFAFQAAFGLIQGWLLSLVLLCVLDLLLPLFLELKGRLLTTLLAVFLMSNTVLIESNYTTSLLSHGIVPVALIAWMIGKFSTKQVKKHNQMTLQLENPTN